MTEPRMCAHCDAVIVRPATRWVHKGTGRRDCGPNSTRTAEPRPRSRVETARDPQWRHVLALYAGRDLLA